MATNSQGINIEGFNAEVRDWTKGSRRELVAEMIKLNIKSTGFARSQLKYSLKKSDGTINRIGFKFPRYMVFVQKGVGKGVPISKVGDPAVKRQPKDWFNTPIGKRVSDLTDAIQPFYSDAIVNSVRLQIR